VVGEHLDRVAVPHRQQAQVTKLAADRTPLWQPRQGAQVVPAERGEVPDRLGMAYPGAKPQREVAAQVSPGRGGGKPAGGQQVPRAAPPGRPGHKRAREQRRRGRLRDGVHQAHPLLVPVQRRPVSEPGGGGRHRGDDPGRDQRRRGARRAPATAQVKQRRRGPAARRDPDQGRMGGLPERHTVQRIGAPAWRQDAHSEVGEGADRAVKGLRALDALGGRCEPGWAPSGPNCGPRRASRLLTEELTHNGEVPRCGARVTPGYLPISVERARCRVPRAPLSPGSGSPCPAR
jgi:hypothetical protein